jgi:hypothetical protein
MCPRILDQPASTEIITLPTKITLNKMIGKTKYKNIQKAIVNGILYFSQNIVQ